MSPAGWIIIGIFLFTILADVLLVQFGQQTESQQLMFWSTHSTAVPYVWGMLGGHWFVGQKQIIVSAWGYAFIPCLALIIWDIVWNLESLPRVLYRFGLIYMLLGVSAGALFWGQNDAGSFLP